MYSLSCYPQQVSIDWQHADLPLVDGRASPGYAGALAGISNGFLVVAGGANFPFALPWEGGKKIYHDKVYVYRIDKTALRAEATTSLPFKLAYSANATTAEGIIAAGGENEQGLSAKVYRITASKNASLNITRLPDLPFPLTNAAIATVKQKIFIAGGETTNGVSDQLLVLDTKDVSSGWQTLAKIPHPVSHTVLLPLGKGIVMAGGRKRTASGVSDLYEDVWMYDLKSNSWNSMPSLPYPLSAGTGIALSKDDILLFGGDQGETFHKVEETIAMMNQEADSVTKERLNQKKNGLLRSHPGFSRDILLYSLPQNKWKRVGSMPSPTPVTTTAIRCEDNFYIPSGETRAGVRSPLILSGKFSIRKK